MIDEFIANFLLQSSDDILNAVDSFMEFIFQNAKPWWGTLVERAKMRTLMAA